MCVHSNGMQQKKSNNTFIIVILSCLWELIQILILKINDVHTYIHTLYRGIIKYKKTQDLCSENPFERKSTKPKDFIMALI